MTNAIGYIGIYSTPEPIHYPPGYIYNLIPQRSGNTKFYIDPGSCRDFDNQNDIDLDSLVEVDVTNVGVNGRNSDSAFGPNNWYVATVIKNPSTGNVAGFAINLNDLFAFTLPAGYTAYRWVGVFKINSVSVFMKGRWHGYGNSREWVYDEPRDQTRVLNNAASVPWALIDCSAVVPWITYRMMLTYYYVPNAISFFRLRQGDSTQADPPINIRQNSTDNSGMLKVDGDIFSQLYYQTSDALDHLFLYVCRYQMEV